MRAIPVGRSSGRTGHVNRAKAVLRDALNIGFANLGLRQSRDTQKQAKMVFGKP